MNFFQSVFSDDPEPEQPEPKPESPQSPNPNPSIQSITSAWSFGSTLIQTLASKSESVIQTYRRDLEEFSSGLKKETAVIREAAVHAVHNLPNSLEAGAEIAQEKLESVGQAIDDLGNTVTSILSIDHFDDTDTDINNANLNNSNSYSNELGFAKAYSRVDAQIRNARSDMNTYLNDPEDLDEFNEWKLGFEIDETSVGEIMNEDGGVVGEIYKEIVPAKVDEVTFWSRYFYKEWKIRRVEEARVMLVKRAISGEEDEELSWDVDEDEYEENVESDLKENVGNEAEVSEVRNEDKDELEVKSDVKTVSEKDSDISVVSSQPSPEEDGWDEIEDVGSSDENKDKVVARGSPDREELRKRLSVAEDEEDLTWDIEDDDDDERVKA